MVNAKNDRISFIRYFYVFLQIKHADLHKCQSPFRNMTQDSFYS